MAKFRKNSFGMPVGKIGGVVYKTWKGIPYVASEPVFTKPITSPVVLESNSKFKLFGALTTRMQSDPRLRSIWEDSEIEGATARHKIMHINYSRVDESRDFKNLRLVPFQQLFPVELLETVVGHSLITFSFTPFPLNYSGAFYPIISAHGILHFFNCREEGSSKLHMIDKISSPVVSYRKGEPHSFSLEWDSDSGASQSFKSRQFCFTLILENRDGVAAACSENVVVNQTQD